MWWITAGVLPLALSLPTAEVRQVDVRRDGNLYQLHVVARIGGSPSAVWRLLTDFQHLERIHHSVRDSTYLGHTPEGGNRVRIRMHPCVMFFCVDFTQVLEFHAVDERQLLADFDQRDSDFHFGQLKWRLARSRNVGTDLVFDADLEPAFWVPPLLGSWVLKRVLRKTATDIVMNLDRLSRPPLP